jgi:OOP family OmpA-OmpF porin
MLDVQFKVGSAKVTPKGGKQITALCDAMRAMENMPSLQLIGHTDRSGKAEKNLEVSQNRAAAVKNYIVAECELPGGLVLTSGEGEAFAPTTGKANNADDRRIEVQLIGAPAPEPAEMEKEDDTAS